MNEMKSFIDGLSVSAFGAIALGWLPHITAVAVAVWSIVRIYEIYLSIKLKRLQVSRMEAK